MIVFVELDKIVVLGFILTPIGVDVLSKTKIKFCQCRNVLFAVNRYFIL